ncbi:MAG: mannosyltransferase [Patescibacteria group bacterium]|nr:MAG: mannosyltransferase [Patescibacteria group bacterium]
MRAALFSPYLDTLGGGERYLLGFARSLLDLGYEVDINWSDKSILSKLQDRFGFNLEGINIVDNIKRGWGYDLCFWLSDGSVPFLFGKRNFLHFQVPFSGVGGSNLLNKIKFIKIEKVIVNSLFTKRFVDKEYEIDSTVVYPPVDVDRFKPREKKENIILSVGRFSQLKQAKNQHILAETFAQMVRDGLRGWKLVLAGGSEVGSSDYLKQIRKISSGYPIEIWESPSFESLVDLYGKSSIFWSASGYGIDDEKQPERVEHFGIVVVEAMASGCVPLVYNAGGHREIVKNKRNGFLWRKTEELKDLTLFLINNKEKLKNFAAVSIKQSKDFSYESFSSKIKDLLGK